MPKSKRKSARLKIPYARGFKAPTAKQRLQAATACPPLRGVELKLEREFTDSSDNQFFPFIPEPTSVDDWLAQYNEEGQTYSKFLKECPWLSKRKMKSFKGTFQPNGSTLTEKYPQSKIYLLPLGEFDAITAPQLSDLADYAERFFQIQVEVLPPVELSVDIAKEEVIWLNTPEGRNTPQADDMGDRERGRRRRSERVYRHTIEARFHQASGRYQLLGRSVLEKVKQIIPQDAFCLMALTMADIFDTPSDLFVAGLAAGNRSVGVFSLKRYNPSLSFSTAHWYEMSEAKIPEKVDREKLNTILQRGAKLLVHEISHLLGVDHCIWFSCCMNGSGHLSEDFRQSMHLCPVDLRKLQRLCGFSVVERYRKLGEFFLRNGLKEEREWVQRRIQYILGS